jgi:hypothetical protein
MACLDVELCDKIDVLNTNILELHLDNLNIQTSLIEINDNVIMISSWVSLVIFFAVVYLLIRWLFRLITNFIF